MTGTGSDPVAGYVSYYRKAARAFRRIDGHNGSSVRAMVRQADEIAYCEARLRQDLGRHALVDMLVEERGLLDRIGGKYDRPELADRLKAVRAEIRAELAS